MNPIRYRGLMRSGVLLAGTALMLSACAHVKPEQMEAELAQVRAEMREGDQAVEERVNARIDGVESRLAGLESDLNQLRDDFDVTVERLEAALRFNTPVHFAFDDDQVRAQDRELLNRFASVIADYYPDATVTVEGFTDSSGSAEYNLRLGQRRADAVADYLQTRGLASERLRAVSYGEEQARQIVPGAQGPGTEGWQNRRVSMVIDFNPQNATMPTVASSGSDDS